MARFGHDSSKAGGEERTEEYRRFRNGFGAGGVTDIDQFEYDPDTHEPLALVELCVADMYPEHEHGVRDPKAGPVFRFFEKCEEKLKPTSGQGAIYRSTAALHRVPVIMVSYINGHLEDGGIWFWPLDRLSERRHSIAVRYRKQWVPWLRKQRATLRAALLQPYPSTAEAPAAPHCDGPFPSQSQSPAFAGDPR